MHETSVDKMISLRDAALCVQAALDRATYLPTYKGKIDPARVQQITARAISDPNHVVYMFKVDGTPILFVGGILSEQLYNFNKRAEVSYIQAPKEHKHQRFMRRAMRECFEAFYQWAIARGAETVSIGYDSGIRNADCIGKILEKQGYREVGKLFYRDAE